MTKKLFYICFLSITHTCLALTCPSIDDLHHQNLSGWNAFDIGNGTPLSNARLEKYTRAIQKFVLAEWMEDAPEGSGHCYYAGNNTSPLYLDAYLAKQNLIPDKTSVEWKNVGMDTMHCRASINECGFMEK